MAIEQILKSIKRVGGKVPLHVFFVFLFVPQIFGTGALIGYLSDRNGQEAVDDLAEQLLDKTSEQTKQHLDTYLNAPLLLAKNNSENARFGVIGFDRSRKTEHYLWSQIKLYPWVESTYLGSERGQFVEVVKDKQGNLFLNAVERSPLSTTYLLNDRGERVRRDKQQEYDPRKRPWYRAARLKKGVQWGPIYFFNDGALGMTASAPFYDANGTFQGATGVDITLTGLSEFLSHLKVSRRRRIFILEPSGELVATSTKVEIIKLKPGQKDKPEAAIKIQDPLTQKLVQEFRKQESGSLGTLKRSVPRFLFNHESHYVRVFPYGEQYGLNWSIVVVIPEKDLMGRVDANRRLTIQLCLLALVIATGVGILTARWLMAPLARFVEATDLLAHGKLDKTVEEGYIREVKILARSFNRMTCRLQAAFFKLEMANAELEERVRERTKDLEGEREKSERLLLNILPEPIAQRLKHDQSAIAEHFEDVTILFADLVGFTSLSARLQPIELVNLLNEIFSVFDTLADYHGLEKIKTIGDAYMVAGGLPIPRADSTDAIAQMALDMLAAVAHLNRQRNENFQVRIGLNTGDVVAGVIGTKKFIYDVWGDTVNVASRMESSGSPGAIQVTGATRRRLEDRFIFEERGTILVKGKGLMKTYWLRAPGGLREAERVSPSIAPDSPPEFIRQCGERR